MERQRLAQHNAGSHRRSRTGQGMLEYALVLALIAVVVIAIVSVVSRRAATSYCSVGSALSGANTVCSADYNAVVIQFAPGAFYRLAEATGTSLTDATGHGNTATATGLGVTYGQRGPVLTPSTGGADSALALNGTAGYFTIPQAPFGSYPAVGGTTVYTVSIAMWFRTSTAGVLLGQYESGGGSVPALYVDTTGHLRGSVFWHYVTTPPLITPGRYNDDLWHHVAITFNNGTESLYVDGFVADQKSSLTEEAFGNGSGVYTYAVGYSSSCNNWTEAPSSCRFTGAVADVAVFPTSLTPEAVATLASGR